MSKSVVLDVPLSIAGYNKELEQILSYQTVHYENMVLSVLGKKAKQIVYPSEYGELGGKFHIDINNSENYRGILLTDGDKVEVEIGLNPPLLNPLDKDLLYLQKILSEVSSDIYITHSDIINLYTRALDETIENDLQDYERSKMSIEAFEKRRREIPEFNKLLNSGRFKSNHRGLKDNFKRLHSEYVSIYEDIEYLKGLKDKYESDITRRLEACRTIDYYMSQKLRLVYQGLTSVIHNIMKGANSGTPDVDGLIDFNYHEYPLKLDKKKGILYAVKSDESLDVIGELEDYTVKKPHTPDITEKSVVSPFLVKKLMLKYVYLKRLCGYHIAPEMNGEIKKGAVVRFSIDESTADKTAQGIGLVKSVRDTKCTIQVINKNINFMDDSHPIDELDVPNEDIVPVCSIREEIKFLQDLYKKELVYNYEIYYRYCKSKGKQPEITMTNIQPQLLKIGYPSLTVRTNSKKVSKGIERVLKERIPHTERDINEPLTNVKYPQSCLYVDGKLSPEYLSELVGILLDADAVTKSHVEHVEYVSNILDTLKRNDKSDKSEAEQEFMFGGGDDNTIFNDFKALEQQLPSSLVEFDGFGGGLENGVIVEGDVDEGSIDTISSGSDDSTQQYGGLDVKNIFITEKNLKNTK